MSTSRRCRFHFLTADRLENPCAYHRGCQFLKRCAGQCGHNTGAGICDGSRSRCDHAGKRLAACACVSVHDPADDRGNLVCTDGIPQTLADFPEKASNLNAYVHEDIAGMNVVQSFAAEDETQEIFEALTDEHQKSFVDAVTYADMFGPVIDFCWGIGAMMLYLVGIRFLGFEKVSVGLLVAFGTYINMFWNPIMNLSNFYNNLVTNLTAAERIFDILDTDADIVDAKDVTELPDIKGSVEFSHVSFTYDKGTPAETKVLSDVSFSVQPGETIALVGPTGAGKQRSLI